MNDLTQEAYKIFQIHQQCNSPVIMSIFFSPNGPFPDSQFPLCCVVLSFHFLVFYEAFSFIASLYFILIIILVELLLCHLLLFIIYFSRVQQKTPVFFYALQVCLVFTVRKLPLPFLSLISENSCRTHQRELWLCFSFYS